MRAHLSTTPIASALALPIAAVSGWAMSGVSLGAHAALWTALFLVNFAVHARLAERATRAGAPPLASVLKLPVTVALCAVGLQVSDARAMLLGLAAASTALLWSAILSTPAGHPAPEERS